MNDSPTSHGPADPAAWGESSLATRTPFSVRPAPARVERWSDPLPEIRDARGEALPSLRDLSMRALIALTLLLQIFVWTRVRGYSVADSVEFMERAQTLVHSEPTIDEGVIRPFGFSSVVLPFFVVADWLGIQDPRPIAWCISLLQIGLALCLVFYSVRVAAQLAGRRAGLVAGLIVGVNPVFLQYSTQPVSDIAAALFIALALQALLARGGFKRGLIGGLWLGAALLMAYKSLLVISVILVIVCLRDGWRGRRHVGGITCGVLAGIAVQALLDRWMFGSFGVGFVNYVVQNVLSVLTSVAVKMQWTWAAHPLYDLRQRLMGTSYSLTGDLSARGVQESWFYVQHLPQMLVWPVIGLLGVGIARSVLRPSWKHWLVIGVLVTSIAVMSNKGSKDYRLWLPLMPLVGALCACGWSMLFERPESDAHASRGKSRWKSARSVRVGLGALLIAAILFFDLRVVRALELRQYGGFWSAIDFVSQRARETYPERAREALRCVPPEVPPPRLKVACAYNWAVYMRRSPLVDLQKLPWQLNFWKRYEESQKVADMEALAEMDFFIVHLPILTEHPDLFEWVNAHYEVLAGYHDQRTFDPGIGPILVLGRRSGRSDALTFFDVHEAPSIDAFRESHELPPALDFIAPTAGSRDRLVFLGYDYRELPGDQHGWITYYWCTPTGLTGNFDFIDRLTSPDETNPWQNNHAAAYGLHPTSTWAPGEIVSEGFPVVASAEPFKPGGPYRPLGGAYRRGDLIPTRLWMAVVEFDPVELHGGQRIEKGHLVPARRNADGPIRTKGMTVPCTTADGVQFSADGLVRVGSFFMPVHPAARLPDDGRPIAH